jgi:hypothetical protein
MVFTIVTIIFLPMSFIAAFFAIDFRDWGNHLTIGYVTKYMFGIGLAISLVFVTMAFLVHDISDAWKSLIRTAGSYAGRLGRPKTPPPPPPPQGHGDQPDDPSMPIARESKPGTAGAASTAAYRSHLGELEWKRGVLDGTDDYTLRISRDHARYGNTRPGLSPLRYGGRKLSVGSGGHGASLIRRSLDARRGRPSGDLESAVIPHGCDEHPSYPRPLGLVANKEQPV